MKIERQIKQARNVVNALEFGAYAWEAAMQKVRVLVEKQAEQKVDAEFFSVDSGFHRTKLLSGRVIECQK